MKPIKTILVTGATGAQGGSVANALLADKKFAVRILTRNAASEKAQALKNAGAEIVTGDFNDIESLLAAMKNCYAVYGVTDYREHGNNEFTLGKNLIDAVVQSNIKHFVFSSLDDYKKLSNGSLPVPAYDIKASLQEYTRQLQIPATFVQASFYYENFLNSFPLMREANGGYSFGFPQGNTKMAAISVEDYGGIVNTVFKYPAEYIGRIVRAAGSYETCAVYAAILSQVLGKHIRYTHIPRDEYAVLGFNGAEEAANMFEVQRLYIPDRLVDLIESYALNTRLRHFRKWVIMNRRKFWDYFESLEQEQAAA